MADTFRVLVTGSRDWDEALTICGALSDVWQEHPGAILVTGACPQGADHIAEYWVKRWGGKIDLHPADWDTYGKAAGYRRNAEMVAAGADLCLAFIKNGSRGASHCAGLAEKAGITTRRYERK